MGFSEYPRRMLSDQVSPQIYALFKKRCKRFHMTSGEALASFIKIQAENEEAGL